MWGLLYLQGDSGSPLVCENADRQWFQVGISSWNIGCGKPGYPSVYVNVSHFVYWLDSIMSGFAVTAENVSQDGIPNTADYSDVTAVTRIEDFTNEYYTAVSDVTGRTNNILSTKVPVSNLEKAENPHTTDPGLSDTTSGDEWWSSYGQRISQSGVTSSITAYLYQLLH